MSAAIEVFVDERHVGDITRVRQLAEVTARWRAYALDAGVAGDAIAPWSGAFEGPNLERARAL